MRQNCNIFQLVLFVIINIQFEEMVFCGSKNDTSRKHKGSHKTVRSAKVYDVNDHEETAADVKGFAPIRETPINDHGRQTKAETYGQQSNTGRKSKLIANKNELNFALDEESGVSTTFEVPTFNYATVLNHSYFMGKNSKVPIMQEDERLVPSYDEKERKRDASGLWF